MAILKTECICLETMSVSTSVVYPAEWLPQSSVGLSLLALIFWDRSLAPVDAVVLANLWLGP